MARAREAVGEEVGVMVHLDRWLIYSINSHLAVVEDGQWSTLYVKCDIYQYGSVSIGGDDLRSTVSGEY